MIIQTVVKALESLAPPMYQEGYDNTGLLTGNGSWDCTGILCSLDCTEAVVAEAIAKNCNLIVAHHPIVFTGLKKINGNNYVERTIIAAIKNDIAIYAIHTNLDNVKHGVNHRIAHILGLVDCKILAPKKGLLYKLCTYVPTSHAPKVTDALFAVGAGKISNYEECSFTTTGYGTFKPIAGAKPLLGEVGTLETVQEQKIEVIFPQDLQTAVLKALIASHPYEEVAYEIIKLENQHQEIGSGLMGTLPHLIEETAFLEMVKYRFGVDCIRHTALLGKSIGKVALCGGSGSFLTNTAIQAGADVYITADVKYHEFFDAENKVLLVDIGHYESEQFTIVLLAEFLQDKFPTFAVLKTVVNTNPVKYFTSTLV